MLEEKKGFSGPPWWVNMLIGAVASFALTYGVLIQKGATDRQAFWGALAATAAPFAGTPLQSRLNSDGSPQSEAYPPRRVWSSSERFERLRNNDEEE